MPEQSHSIEELVIKYLHQTLTAAEKDQLNEWLNANDDNRLLFEKLTDQQWVSKELESFYRYDEESGWEKLRASFPLQRESHAINISKQQRWKRWAVAASLLLAAGIAGYWLVSNRNAGKNYSDIERPAANDIAAPSRNIATITLANGQKIYLDSAQNGPILLQGNIKLVKLANGQIVYETAEGQTVQPMQFNTLENPKGSKVIDMLLADGSHVWLNAGSSITYPVFFAGNEREVAINGEAYFEIAHAADKPFKVKKGETEVTVLGTHFNINAYDDEPDIKVTLLQGAVNVFNGSAQSRLQPGEQAQIGTSIKVVRDADVETIVAWKNGLFAYRGTHLEEMMRDISRWYNVDVRYEGEIPDKRFAGKIFRSANLTQVLRILEESDVHYRIEGKEIVIVPKDVQKK